MKSFNEIYQEVNEDSAKELNKLKKENRLRNIFLILVIIALCIIGIFSKNVFLIILSVILLIVMIIILTKQYAKYKAAYKEKVIKRFIKGYSENLDYYPMQGISSDEYYKAGFDLHYDIYRSDDLITGKILENCNISMAEVHTKEKQTTRDSDGNTTTQYVTVFHGLFAKINLDKMLTLRFEIIKNIALSDMFKGKLKLDMDSSDFEKLFDVITDDKISTLRILTADVMQMLIDFKNENKVLPEIILNNSTLYIRYAVGEVFEPNLIKSDMNYEKLKKTYNMINFTFELAKNFSKNIMDFDQ